MTRSSLNKFVSNLTRKKMRNAIHGVIGGGGGQVCNEAIFRDGNFRASLCTKRFHKTRTDLMHLYDTE